MALGFRLINDHVLNGLHSLPNESVDLIVTSGPYFRQRDYHHKKQIGQEEKPEQYIGAMSEVDKECLRVLKRSGSMFWNINDTYATAGGLGSHSGLTEKRRGKKLFVLVNKNKSGKLSTSRGTEEHKLITADVYKLSDKGLILIPERLAIQFQNDGWVFRNRLIWVKPCCMPGGAAAYDRFDNTYEIIYMCSKSPHYYYDKDAAIQFMRDYAQDHQKHQEWGGGDVFIIAPAHSTLEHYAMYPLEIPRRLIGICCPRGGVVLDPFSGLGSTGIAAIQCGCYYIGIELIKKYIDDTLERFKNELKPRSIKVVSSV